MPVNIDELLKQIDLALAQWKDIRGHSQYEDCSDIPDVEVTRVLTILGATIERIAPQGSLYLNSARATISKYGESNGYALQLLAGILSALRADLAAGYLKSVEELIHADVFGDFIGMAEHFLAKGYKDASAVIAGGVLETHLRNLCRKYCINVLDGEKYKKASRLNDELAGAKAYSGLDQKGVGTWLDLRNNAAHAHYDQYTSEQVGLMLNAVRDFVTRNPA